ncbi:hypothetical protein [Aquabacterium sp.]|uniref:hypothetical protein n=1 Tax=Aquabacterium sp. TaxID=1872578 RepID=UPI002C5C3D7C|nr:hypothetical protein [Aquabacterium sp.]HSW04515.1 hypothetical protein [Aquabacterium sp.]
MKWLYFPFQDVSADPTMPSNEARYRSKYGPGLTVLQYPHRLDHVPDDDTFIVAGHGLPGMDAIGVSVLDENASSFENSIRALAGKGPAKRQVTMQANDLAQQLRDAELPRTHKRIKLITCGGAGMAILDDAKVEWDSSVDAAARTVKDVPAAPFASANTANCFASVFAKAMAQRDYTQLRVRAYPGFVNANGVQNPSPVKTPNPSPASHRR